MKKGSLALRLFLYASLVNFVVPFSVSGMLIGSSKRVVLSSGTAVVTSSVVCSPLPKLHETSADDSMRNARAIESILEIGFFFMVNYLFLIQNVKSITSGQWSLDMSAKFSVTMSKSSNVREPLLYTSAWSIAFDAYTLAVGGTYVE